MAYQSFNLFFILALLLSLLSLVFNTRRVHQHSEYDDNDFAEFEDFDEGIPGSGPPPRRPKAPVQKEKPEKIIIEDNDPNDANDPLVDEDSLSQDDEEKNIVQLKEEEMREIKIDHDDEDEEEAIVEEEDENDEFSHFADEDEFIGFDTDRVQNNGRSARGKEEPKITIAKVPLHLRSNWDSFYLEMLMMAGLIVYFINFILGKSKNQRIATSWFTSHKALLESNFTLVGDDGKSNPPVGPPHLLKESENVYILWCSGRSMVEGMLIEIKLLKRQDLIGVISQLMRPSSDQLIVKINLEVMDSFVFCVGTKKSVGKLSKEMSDISTFCPEKKSAERLGLGAHYVVHVEIAETSNVIMRDPKVSAVLSKFPDLLEYMHFSDQYSGVKQQEETSATKLPEVKKTLVFCFNLPGMGQTPIDDMSYLKPLMQLVFHMSDKISRMKLSKEGKAKGDKNRSKVEEAFLKSIHNARAEIAQQAREDKKRLERERIMNLDDPDKQRKWEERENKRQMKKRAPKMKTLKIKPM